jgi:hypothetical protein
MQGITCISVIVHPISQSSLDISLLSGLALLQQKSENYNSIHFYVGSLFSDDFHSDSTLILKTIAMKHCMDTGARPHVCGVSE